MSRPGGRGALIKVVVCVLAIAGVGLTVGFVIYFGWRPLAHSFGALGWIGFLVFCTYTLLLFVLLGFCWFIIVPHLGSARLPAFIFGRLMREAVADILPFSQLGGFVLGARAAALLGAPGALAAAASIIDIVAEVVGQILFTGLGVLIMLKASPITVPSRLIVPILVTSLAAAIGLALLLAMVRWSGPGGLERLVRRLPSAWRDKLGAVQRALKELLRHPVRALASTALHFAAWIMASGGVWLILQFMQIPIRFGAVIALESLVYVLRSAAFVVPGAIGLLESSYVVLGAAFGLSPETALSVALIKRARDVAIGLPVVLAWQILEGRRLLAPAGSSRGQPTAGASTRG